MHATLPLLAATDFPPLARGTLETLQVNLGYRCNQACLHCHVNAGPQRTEIMQRETIDALLQFMDTSPLKHLDLTGGAPELNPLFRMLVSAARARGIGVIDRCNLTVLLEQGQEDTARFLADHDVRIVASLPCYLRENVDRQRGDGVFECSLQVLRHLNELGYGTPGSGRLLDLVFNPQGPQLPPPQAALEAAARAMRTDRLGYWESAQLRERISRHYADWYGMRLAPDRVVLTPGASGALLLAFTVLLEPGDRVALGRPGYPAYRNVLYALGMHPVELPCGPETRFQPTAEMIEALDPAPAALIVASPANPTGTMLGRQELEAIAAVCRRRDIVLISDEIYHGITYGQRAVSAL